MNLLMFRTLPRRTQRKLLLRHVRVDEQRLQNVEIYPTERREDVKAALSLVYEVYAAKGKVGPNPARLHVTKHNAQPASVIFAARQADQLGGTIALIPDSPLGLPIDCVQRAYMDELRARGLKICEISGLACSSDLRGSGLALYLYRAAVHAAIQESFDVVVITSQPKGALIYSELLVCESFGAPAHHTSFNDRHPSTALRLDLRTCEGRLYERFDGLTDYQRSPHYLFYGKEVPQIRLPRRFSVTSERIDASADLIHARPEPFQRLTPIELSYLKKAVPTANWTPDSPVFAGRFPFPPQVGAQNLPLLPQAS
ncbi:N-acyl amino acid synthase FeeM domain-containing protein [Kribbella sp. CA-253562]|uniref:N-acyl amino acid synthase FeeM domain-containing protein n=1 Tax=Kribbella sp. CA-253562 TaxID=3239942 RepID=UPI003D8CD42D